MSSLFFRCLMFLSLDFIVSFFFRHPFILLCARFTVIAPHVDMRRWCYLCVSFNFVWFFSLLFFIQRALVRFVIKMEIEYNDMQNRFIRFIPIAMFICFCHPFPLLLVMHVFRFFIFVSTAHRQQHNRIQFHQRSAFNPSQFESSPTVKQQLKKGICFYFISLNISNNECFVLC